MATTPPILKLLPAGDAPMVERIEHLTDVSTSLNGTEARKPLRAFPRYSYSARYVLSNQLAGTTYAEHAEREAVLALLRDQTQNRVRMAIGPALAYRATGGPIPAIDMLRKAGVSAGEQPIAYWNLDTSSFATGATGDWAGQGWLWAAPLLEVELQDSREIEHTTNQLHAFQLQLALTGFDESFDPAITVTEPFTAPAGLVRHNWISPLQESLAITTDRFDNGHLPLALQRYSQRSVSLDLLLMTRADILAFRRFVFACQGRFRSFLWRCPTDTDPTPTRWRLGSDAVEIEYMNTRLAKVRLLLTRTDQ